MQGFVLCNMPSLDYFAAGVVAACLRVPHSRHRALGPAVVIDGSHCDDVNDESAVVAAASAAAALAVPSASGPADAGVNGRDVRVQRRPAAVAAPCSGRDCIEDSPPGFAPAVELMPRRSSARVQEQQQQQQQHGCIGAADTREGQASRRSTRIARCRNVAEQRHAQADPALQPLAIVPGDSSADRSLGASASGVESERTGSQSAGSPSSSVEIDAEFAGLLADAHASRRNRRNGADAGHQTDAELRLDVPDAEEPFVLQVALVCARLHVAVQVHPKIPGFACKRMWRRHIALTAARAGSMFCTALVVRAVPALCT